MKLSSMTGYAVVESILGNRKVRIHAKSVNHRFFEFRWKTPRSWFALEAETRLLFQKSLGRGSLDIWIEEWDNADPPPDKASQQTETRIGDFFRKLRLAVNEGNKDFSHLSLPLPIRALILSRYPDLWMESRKEQEIQPETQQELVKKLSIELKSAREKEGTEIGKAIIEQLKCIQHAARSLETQLTHLRKDWEGQYRERIAKIAEDLKTLPPPEERLVQEFLVLAERRDIAEEMQRISTHLASFEQLMNHVPENAGKRIEFLLQELHREWTTLGNKIRNAEHSAVVIEAKLALEKIREQAMNLA